MGTLLRVICNPQAGSELRLNVGGRSTGIAVVPDNKWPAMWRVRTPDGRLSDMVNLTRTKNAAVAVARPKGLGRDEIVHWDHRQTASGAGTARKTPRPLLEQFHARPSRRPIEPGEPRSVYIAEHRAGHVTLNSLGEFVAHDRRQREISRHPSLQEAVAAILKSGSIL
jgi:hypothetical protein